MRHRGAGLPLCHRPAPPVVPGQPSPVSTSAQLASSCVTGIEDASTSTFYTMAEVKAGDMISAAQDYDQFEEAYQVTLTNNGSVTADVTGLAVVFYGESGTELTSDQESTGSSFITPGQSLTYTRGSLGPVLIQWRRINRAVCRRSGRRC